MLRSREKGQNTTNLTTTKQASRVHVLVQIMLINIEQKRTFKTGQQNEKYWKICSMK